MKADEFCNKALEYEKLPTLYKLGKFMNSYSGKYLLCDCSGLIKGILWGYPHSGAYKSNGVPDINADTMIKQCSKTSSNFEHLPIGAIVHMKGHIGIHVGNGKTVFKKLLLMVAVIQTLKICTHVIGLNGGFLIM